MYSIVRGDLLYLGHPALFTITSTFHGAVSSAIPPVAEIAPQGREISGLLAPDVRTSCASFYGSRIRQVFKNASFSETTFQSANLDGCQFIDCDFGDVAFDLARLNGAQFVNCDVDASFGESDLSNSKFIDCRMCVLFDQTLLTGSAFEDVTLSGALRNLDVSTVRARNSILRELVDVDPNLCRRLMERGFSVESYPQDVELMSIIEVLDPEPSDETEAWFRRNILGERFRGDPCS